MSRERLGIIQAGRVIRPMDKAVLKEKKVGEGDELGE